MRPTQFFGVVGLYFAISTMNLDWAQWNQLMTAEGYPIIEMILNIFKWLAVAATPALAFTTIGHLVWAPTLKKKAPTFKEMVADGSFEGCKLRFRYVTRGKYPQLIKENCVEAARILRKTCPDLPERYW